MTETHAPVCSDDGISFADAVIEIVINLETEARGQRIAAQKLADLDALIDSPALDVAAKLSKIPKLVAGVKLAEALGILIPLPTENMSDAQKLDEIKKLTAIYTEEAKQKLADIDATMERLRSRFLRVSADGAQMLSRFAKSQRTDWEPLQRLLRESFSASPDLALGLFQAEDWTLPVASFEQVRHEELKEIKKLREMREMEGSDPLSDPALFGLALSGGGIRSATFNLGVIESLAEFNLLKKVDILSTVSGGGYIGGWLAAWIKREKIDLVQAQLKAAVSSHRIPVHSRDDISPGPISFLRQFSNYLTPSRGIFSLDSWTMGAIYLRNVTLNQVILASLIGALLLLPRYAVMPLMADTEDLHNPWTNNWLIWSALVLIVLATTLIGMNLWRATSPPEQIKTESTKVSWLHRAIRYLNSFTGVGVQFGCAAVMLLGVELASIWFWQNPDNPALGTLHWSGFWAGAFLVFFLLSIQITTFGRSFHCVAMRHQRSRFLPFYQACLLLPSVVSAFAALCFLRGYLLVLAFFQSSDNTGAWHATIWSPVMLLLVLGTPAILHVGLLGIYIKDEGREWLTRFRAVTNLWMFYWAALGCAALYGPFFMIKIKGWASLVSFSWAASTAASLIAAQSARTGDTQGGNPRTTPLDIVVRIGPPVFLVGFLVAISFVEYLLLAYQGMGTFNLSSSFAQYCQAMQPSSSLSVLALALAATGLILAWRVDINEFSMHQFYKNRLVHCYFGASNTASNPNPFTGFDSQDDVPLADLKASKGYTGPWHIVNATMNVSAGKNLAWQERKGASFVFTPGYCGFDLGVEKDYVDSDFDRPHLASHAYRSTCNYAYPGGIHLGTTVAISGAAADPNQGYHTSAAVAFLMTVFDVRLGWWLGNPRRNQESAMPGPRFGLAALVSELLGRTDDTTRFVSLSDGGHFDNMGLYELVRRGCRFIILSDAEQDGNYRFEGLGTAIRKCRIDFGAEIDIDPKIIIPDPVTKRSGAHCAVGTIHYAGGSKGTLVYIKASLTGAEPSDVLQYAASQPTFPHETTANQWFTESQFESYRRLGYDAARTTLQPAEKWGDTIAGRANPQSLFDDLRKCWYPANPALRAHAAKHTGSLAQLLSKLSETTDLRDLGSQLFPIHESFLADEDRSRIEFYFVMIVLQLVEDVYFDLQLDNDSWQQDPRIGGWIRLFEDWSKSDKVDAVWRLKRETFRKDFQTFWDGIRAKGARSAGLSLSAKSSD